jgi:hypothetical protein
MPSTPPQLIHGLEVWLIGTREQLGAAVDALRDVMSLPGRIEPWPGERLAGGDVGRFRLYLRGFPRTSNSPTRENEGLDA